jgi:hypothetical protein
MSTTVVENAKSDVTTVQSLAGKYLTFAWAMRSTESGYSRFGRSSA